MPINGKIKLLGDKSISHRALILGSILNGVSSISNLSNANDILSTIECLKKCGIKVSKDKYLISIYGGKFITPIEDLNCGNSGTTARLMLGLLSGLNLCAKIVGDSSLSNRPMDRVIEPLSFMGASLSSVNNKLPIFINKTKQLMPIEYTLPISSAQVKSSILFASLYTKGLTKIYEKYKSRDHTEIMLKEFGFKISKKDSINISNPSFRANKIKMDIPGDPSSAAFLIAAAVMIPGSKLSLKNILCNPTRIKYIDIIKDMGGDIKIHNQKQVAGELIGDILINYKPLVGIRITPDIIPQIIDEIPILSIIATQAKGKTCILGINELKFKECDRIQAIHINLKAMGASINTTDNSIEIKGQKTLHSTTIKTFSDHRIAMTFVIAGLLTGRHNKIDDTKCIKTSFPDFFKVLQEIST